MTVDVLFIVVMFTEYSILYDYAVVHVEKWLVVLYIYGEIIVFLLIMHLINSISNNKQCSVCMRSINTNWGTRKQNQKF